MNALDGGRKRGCEAMSRGYTGKLLDVDLGAKQAVEIDLDEEILQDFIGGLGLAVKIMYDEIGPDIDAFSPKNIVIIATGPLSGTRAPTNGRTHIVTKSPLTGILGMGNFGGWWGPRLKRAGLEAIVIRGKSNAPVYLWIDEGTVQIKSAEHLWGKDTFETTDALKQRLGEDVSVLSIGQAGENLVRFACPVADYHHAPGRSHAGCVMGDKKLKAVVVRGTKEVAIADSEKFTEAVSEAVARIANYPDKGERPRIGSHSGLVSNWARAGAIRSGNFLTEELPPDSDLFRLPASFKEVTSLSPGYYGYHCPMAKYYGCDILSEIRSGPYAGVKIGGLAFSEVAIEWGGRCGIKSYPAMFKCRELCQRYGMDEVTQVPFAIELFKNGILTKEDCDGLELTLGNEDAIMQMLGKIAQRQSLGDILAEGSERAARRIGKSAGKYLLSVKGHELMDDPRTIAWPHILGRVVCPRGGDDLNTTHYNLDMAVLPPWAIEAGWNEGEYLQWLVSWVDMFDDVRKKIYGSPPRIESIRKGTIEGRAALVRWSEQLMAVFDSLGLCLLAATVWCALGPTHYAKLYSAGTGWQVNPRELMSKGERIFNLMKAYNVREGLTRKDDAFSARCYQEPSTGPMKGAVVSRDKLAKLLDEYYELGGWDKETGIPTRSKLIELNLEYVADELAHLGFISD